MFKKRISGFRLGSKGDTTNYFVSPCDLKKMVSPERRVPSIFREGLDTRLAGQHLLLIIVVNGSCKNPADLAMGSRPGLSDLHAACGAYQEAQAHGVHQ